MQYFDQRGGGFVNTAVTPQATQASGFGSGFGSFLSDVGRNIVNPISSIFSSVNAARRPQNVIQQPALTTQTSLGARETQASGTSQAFVGGLAGLPQIAGRFLGSRAGQVATAIGGGAAASLLGGSSGQVRITRKTKRLAQQAYSLAMGDLGSATSLFTQLSGISVSEMDFVKILTKRFRNDGAVVTKAALRKTKTTIRRMKSMCDMYDSLRPAATRRRTPMKRAATTLISNK
tara:strand:- start:153 stop:851 length:699 start_codon:yes stop_codon:yes gene_type:complete